MRWRRIGCLGCLLVSLVVFTLAFVFFDTLIDLFKLEFTESNLQPIPNTTAIVPSSESMEVNDLAYIQVFVVGYTDDADPEYEGISIDVTFFDSKSEIISFSDVPLILNIELYAYRNPQNMFNLSNGDLVYEGSVSVDHSMRLVDITGSYIRIPFQEIHVDQNIYQPFGTLRVIVSIPVQGEFEVTEEFAPLYPYQDGQ